MTKGKQWYVYELEYPEEGMVAKVRARSEAGAVAQVRSWDAYQRDSNGVLSSISDEEPVELAAIRVSLFNRARAADVNPFWHQPSNAKAQAFWAAERERRVRSA